ncbi:MAG: F0F1 ATP synthase subunit B [Campylobacterota bacterium]|nr:F0F1 ATP synthase subunit B [Campylobacterota bacterium]
MGKIVLTLLMVTGYAFASGGESGGGTDIVERTINFLIFAGIIYYLLADPIKNFFVGRSQGIAGELEKVQERLRESKRAKEAAELEIEEAKKFAEELKETSKKENKILNDRILEQCEAELENIQKQSAALMDLDQRQMVRDVVNDIMEDVFEQESAAFDKEAMAQIIMKKVA